MSRERFLLGLKPSDADAIRGGLKIAAAELDLPNVSGVLPEVLDQVDLPGLVKTAIKAVPDSVVDKLLPTRELLIRCIDNVYLKLVIANPGAAEHVLEDAVIDAAGDQVVASLKDLFP